MDGKILVTGGAGYVGSHVVVALAEAGYTPIILDNFATSSRAVLPRLSALTGSMIDLVEADVRDRVRAARDCSHDQPIVAVVHCAALKGVGESARSVRSRTGTSTSAARCRSPRSRARRAWRASSIRARRRPSTASRTRLPVTEDAPLKPQSVYGRTKRVVRGLPARPRRARTPTGASRSCATSIPPARTVGAHRRAQRRSARATSCRFLCRIAAGEVGELAIFGRDWPTEDGTGVRDYLHVVDLAEAHVAARAIPRASAPGVTTFNLGMGRGCSVLAGRRRVRARLRAPHRAHVRAAAPGRRAVLLRGPVARGRPARVAGRARPRLDLRRRVALAAVGGVLIPPKRASLASPRRGRSDLGAARRSQHRP